MRNIFGVHSVHCQLCMSCNYTADIDVGGNSTQTGRIVSGTANYTADISINAKADQIGQEGVETFEILLSVISDELAVPVFVEGPAMITVNDKSGEKVTHAHTHLLRCTIYYPYRELYCAKVWYFDFGAANSSNDTHVLYTGSIIV